MRINNERISVGVKGRLGSILNLLRAFYFLIIIAHSRERARLFSHEREFSGEKILKENKKATDENIFTKVFAFTHPSFKLP